HQQLEGGPAPVRRDRSLMPHPHTGAPHLEQCQRADALADQCSVEVQWIARQYLHRVNELSQHGVPHLRLARTWNSLRGENLHRLSHQPPKAGLNRSPHMRTAVSLQVATATVET